MKKRLISLIGLFYFISLWGQKDSCSHCGGALMRRDTGLYVYGPLVRKVSLNLVGGFLMPHHEDMIQMYHHISSAQLRITKNFSQSKTGVSLKAHQHLGYFIGYYNLGSSISGKGIAAGINFNSVITGSRSKHQLYFDYVFGLGYLTETYDPYKNPENRAIGSHLNGYVQFGVGYDYLITNQISMGMNLALSHFSNASWKFPNLGINLPSAGIHIKYQYQTHKKLNPVKLPKLVIGHHQTVSFRMGHKEFDFDDNRGFTMAMCEYQYETKLTLQSNLRFGISAFYDPTYGFQKFKPLPSYSVKNTTELGVSVGYESKFGRWGILTDLGIYVYKPKMSAKKPYYEGIGLRYYIDSKWSAIVRLKANGTVADFAEFGVALKL